MSDECKKIMYDALEELRKVDLDLTWHQFDGNPSLESIVKRSHDLLGMFGEFLHKLREEKIVN